MTQDNPIPDFWFHVACVYDAGKDVEHFDIAGRATAIELIEYVVKHKDALLEKLKGEG